MGSDITNNPCWCDVRVQHSVVNVRIEVLLLVIFKIMILYEDVDSALSGSDKVCDLPWEIGQAVWVDFQNIHIYLDKILFGYLLVLLVEECMPMLKISWPIQFEVFLVFAACHNIVDDYLECLVRINVVSIIRI